MRLQGRCLPAAALVFLTSALVASTTTLQAADPSAARAAFYRGDYDACIEIASQEVERGVWNDFWSKILVKSLLEVGRYNDAVEVYENVLERFPSSLRLRMMAAEAYRFSGNPVVGQRLLDEIPYLVQRSSWRYRDAENLLAIGEFTLNEGEDAREVLAFYDAILSQDSKAVDAHIATAKLALQKSDFQEAAKSLAKALELRPEDPDIHFLLSQSWAPSDPERAEAYLQAALNINSRHSPSMLEVAELLITSEKYTEANGQLDRVLKINPLHSQAWAYKAAIAHLEGEYEQEAECRSKGLSTWKVNPAVDFWIGEQLSKHYRFLESVTYQRRSLRYDPGYLPAKFQLGQDLLRMGLTDEGWTLVDSVAEADEYNVVAYNLKTLRKRLDGFATLRSEGIILRMDASEASIYGERAMDLLHNAKDSLCAKYDIQLKLPITVEIFPQQNDFAIRTFGLPGGDGFLGVCFGSLITANSPASQAGMPTNWESVLWHEFCHVVTLQKTNNKMPRWLSEGISVHEELQQDITWGQQMTPLYRSMLLGDAFVPLSQLSGAFMSPESPVALQFAYFESALAVKYLIDVHGLDRLQRLLVDLGVGLPAASAFERLYGDPQVLDAEFRTYITELAEGFAEGVDFDSKRIPEGLAADALVEWATNNRDSYPAMQLIAQQLVRSERFEDGLKQAQKLVELFPGDYSESGPHYLIAKCARALELPDEEARALQEIVDNTSDSLDALRRLIDLRRNQGDWTSVANLADRVLAINPLLPFGHTAARDAAIENGQTELLVDSLQALQQMNPSDPALLHYQLAVAMRDTGKLERARIEVLEALAETPRYREAQLLLVEIFQDLHAPGALRVNRPVDGQPPQPAEQPTPSVGL